ncbi:MAG: hypothetical protein U0793_24725 [Gemmataceae bacterium]
MLPLTKPLVGEVERYHGIYVPGAPCILVRAPRVRRLVEAVLTLLILLVGFALGFWGETALVVFVAILAFLSLFYPVERWEPVLADDLLDFFPEKGGLVVFEGVVSARGWYGTKGRMHREVEIVRILPQGEGT